MAQRYTNVNRNVTWLLPPFNQTDLSFFSTARFFTRPNSNFDLWKLIKDQIMHLYSAMIQIKLIHSYHSTLTLWDSPTRSTTSVITVAYRVRISKSANTAKIGDPDNVGEINIGSSCINIHPVKTPAKGVVLPALREDDSVLLDNNLSHWLQKGVIRVVKNLRSQTWLSNETNWVQYLSSRQSGASHEWYNVPKICTFISLESMILTTTCKSSYFTMGGISNTNFQHCCSVTSWFRLRWTYCQYVMLYFML